ncbi:protein dead ringer homolog [Daktulosphaira vitifoliae]|uniref:protein dead ringer homolog n=1 Tax=Daktulosphaira vitifoliae TaxID=58002 RepID=UPI0021AA2A18|nr:protein dead ringer homolog [Daktulosphaira vitifoliae]XP_050549001.1 protein dead ringer homolog [Daktulosphaira vitifoliae]XP_050549002.1 protein dead ringer homolog [Daktulosphaira vitifoliae]
MATDATDSSRLGLNLNLSMTQPHAYHWLQSPKVGGSDDDDNDEDDRRKEDDDCSPEDDPEILEMQREERETLNQLARRLATAPPSLMLQHLVYPRLPGGVAMSMAPNIANVSSTRGPSETISPLGSSRSSLTPPGQDYNSENGSSRKGEAQSWTFEEQFRQLYTAGNETDRRSFLDSLFSFMQEQGTPISRLPIMAKRVLDLYTLYKLVVQRGGIVAVITKKLWQEIIRGLGLPPSITSAAFTLRTQYVKYLYAYESRMNQFSSLEELNMAIAGNRREGRRNKSLLSEYLPQMAGGHHLSDHPLSASPTPLVHQHHQQQQLHYANVMAAEDRFRHLAAAIMDTRQRAAVAEQTRQPHSSSGVASPLAASVAEQSFNGHQNYLPVSPNIAHRISGDQSTKQRELLSMLMWMDLMRANQTAGMSKLPMPNIPPTSPPSNAYAAMNLTHTAAAGLQFKTSPVPEQCEALNLGKKRPANNNNAGEDSENDHSFNKRIKYEGLTSPAPEKIIGRGSDDEEDHRSKTTSPVINKRPIPSPERQDYEEIVEMDIKVSSGLSSNGLTINVSRKTKGGVYIGQLAKSETALNGRVDSPFLLRLNGELYTGHLQLRQNNQRGHYDRIS